VGAIKAHHLSDATAALDITLTDEEIDTLEASYTPTPTHRLLTTHPLPSRE
jgi:aryl-alcohol dehydrogenase-like predicted oxidoreductase